MPRRLRERLDGRAPERGAPEVRVEDDARRVDHRARARRKRCARDACHLVRDVVAPYGVPELHLVGGTCRFPGIAGVVSAVTGLPARVPADPLFVTALGLAHADAPHPTTGPR